MMRLLLLALLLLQATPADAEKKIKDRQAALTTALKSAKTPPETMVVADALVELAEEAVKENLYDPALKVLDQAQKIGTAAKDLSFVLRVSGRSRELQDLQKEFLKARAALKTVLDSPDDAEANLAVGRFLCFHKNEWELGIANLAKGSDKDLKAVAEKELAAGAEGKGAAEIGHAWWALGEKKGPDQARLRSRAMTWYQKSWDSLDKVERLQVRDRARSMVLLKPLKNDKPILEGPPGWGLPKNAAKWDDHFAKTGAYSLQFSNVADAADLYIQQMIPVQAGEAYEISVWGLSEGEVHAAINVYFRLKEGTAEGRVLNLASDTPFWTRVGFEIKAPDTAVTAGIQLKIYVGPGRVWADDFTFRKVGSSANLIDNGSFEKSLK